MSNNEEVGVVMGLESWSCGQLGVFSESSPLTVQTAVKRLGQKLVSVHLMQSCLYTSPLKCNTEYINVIRRQRWVGEECFSKLVLQECTYCYAQTVGPSEMLSATGCVHRHRFSDTSCHGFRGSRFSGFFCFCF